MNLPVSLLVALQFLTRLPVRLQHWPDDAGLGRSLLWYPAVGLLLGALLAAVGVLPLPLLPLGALLLALWVGLSGALHLDGLADTVDAFAGGHGERERTLALMKDPCCGPMAVTALVLLLLLKFAALVALLARGEPGLLLLPLVLGRVALLALLLGTPYVREGGLGSVLVRHVPQATGWKVVLVTVLLVLLAGMPGAVALLAATVVFVMWRRTLLQRLGGTTGDTAGAMVELVETAVLLVLVC